MAARNSFNSSPERRRSSISSLAPRQSNIKVIARFRPLLDFEYRLSELKESITFPSSSTVGLTKGKEVEYFTFDSVFSPDSRQEEVYECVGRPTIEDVLNGYNGTIFAYGQTGSGKTHTMMGQNIFDSDTRGVIPRAVRQIFEAVELDSGDIEYTIKCSMLEVYKEGLRDLLEPQPINLKIKQSPCKGIYVQGLTEVSITSEEDMLEVVALGEQIRAVASTRLNKTSSRSHLIVIIEVIQKLANESEKRGKLNLVDLAGSEKVNLSGVTGTKLEETKKINLSLSALGNVIHALIQKSDHIPYRDSKLTRLLQESLGGNYKTTLLVTCTPSPKFLEETYNTLCFAVRAKAIKNKVKINIKNSIDSYLQIIEQMKIELDSARMEIQILRGEKEVNTTSDSRSVCSTPAHAQEKHHNRKQMKLVVSIDDLRSSRITDMSRVDKKSPDSMFDTDSFGLSFDKQISDLSCYPNTDSEIIQKITEKYERETENLHKKNTYLTRENRELTEKVKTLEHELTSSRTKLLKAEQLSHEYYEIYHKTAISANKDTSELKSLREQNENLCGQIKVFVENLKNLDERQKRSRELRTQPTCVEFEELTDASIPRDYVPIITEGDEVENEQTTAFNLETLKVMLTIDPEKLNSTTMYSTEVRKALEHNTELNREIIIFQLKSQVLHAGTINANLMRTIHALSWKIELQKHKYRIKKTLAKNQEQQIKGLEKMIDHLHGSHMHIMKLFNQIDHEKLVPKTEFIIPRSLMLKPFTQKPWKATRTPKPCYDQSVENSVQGALSLEGVSYAHDSAHLSIRYKSIETSLELQKLYNVELKKANELQKQQAENYKNILRSLEQDIFQVQRLEKERWRKFFSELKENCENELTRKQTEVITLNQVLGEWIDKFMALQESMNLPEKLLPKSMYDEVSFLIKNTLQIVSKEKLPRGSLPKVPLKKPFCPESMGYVKPNGDSPI